MSEHADQGYKNPLRRFLFRSDLCKRVKKRLEIYLRRVTKDESSDLARLFGAESPKVILDVGANVGFLSWQYQKLFKEATVYALEPDPVAFQALQATHGGNPRIRSFPLAAADKDGELDFVQRPISCNSSLLGVAVGAGVTTETIIKIRARTIDGFAADQSILHIDLLKVDTEGADLLVLRGAKGMLERGFVDVIMTEILFVPTYAGQASLDEIAGFLKGYGFRVFNLYIGHETQCGQAVYGNAIFIGSRLQKKLGKTK